MEKYSQLALMLLPFVPSSYSNRWWSLALQRSFQVHGDHNLRVLNEEQLQIDVMKNGSQWFDYPVFVDGFKPEAGFYHLNVQTSHKMFIGFMEIQSDESIIWWASNGGDSIQVGRAGDSDRYLNDYRFEAYEEQLEWINAQHCFNNFPEGTTIYDILKY